MPNYNDRRYRSEEARREAEMVQMRYGLSPRTMPHIRSLTEYAQMLDEMNEREERRGDREERQTMAKYRENPGRYNPQDYPRSDYDAPEMARRRRDSRGRYMHYDDQEGIYPYHEHPTMPHMMHDGDHTKSKQKIGFASSEKHEDMFEEMEEYWNDYMKHKQLYEQTKSPEEKEHMKLELEELAEYIGDFLKNLQRKATTPEEMQIVRGMMQKVQQKNAGGQSF